MINNVNLMLHCVHNANTHLYTKMSLIICTLQRQVDLVQFSTIKKISKSMIGIHI